jgi:hypothetical protein
VAKQISHKICCSVIRNYGRKGRPDTQAVTVDTVVIPDVKIVSEKFKQIGKKYNISTIFKMKHILHNAFTRTKSNIRNQQTTQCI